MIGPASRVIKKKKKKKKKKTPYIHPKRRHRNWFDPVDRLWEATREQKILKEHLPRDIHHQVYNVYED